jgi:hypothetical protein
MSGKRDSWWFLIQKDDGTLHVKHTSDGRNSNLHIDREVPLNDFLRSGGLPELQALIDRMFEDTEQGSGA